VPEPIYDRCVLYEVAAAPENEHPPVPKRIMVRTLGAVPEKTYPPEPVYERVVAVVVDVVADPPNT
jgi:hypothetical protein